MTNEAAPTILIVDDNPNNLRVLEGILRISGYKVRPALNGEAALRSAQAAPPDLVLLDIRMPGLDGFEVCRRLKESEQTCGVPVIFISALQETEEKMRAFQLGGVDYIVKPFQAEEVLARARTHIELARVRSDLEQTNLHLEDLVAQRTQALSESNLRLKRAMREEHALRELLALSHQHHSAHDYLARALDVLVDTLGWQPPRVKTAFLLTRQLGAGDTLDLVVAEGLLSSRVSYALPVDLCLPGKDQVLREEAVSEEVCPLRSSFGVEPGYYTLRIPLVADDARLGLLVLFVADDAGLEPDSEALLRQIADVLVMGLVKRYADERIAWIVYHDELTNLPNRRLLGEQLERELRRAERNRSLCGILFVDLDHFKRLNDAMGHAAGDQYLRTVAERLRQAAPGQDALYRWGSDEFVVLLPDIGAEAPRAIAGISAMANRLNELLAQPVTIADQDIHLQASMGIALYPLDGVRADELLKHADMAMHEAKQSGGRGVVHFYKADMQDVAEQRLQLEKDLRRALTESQFLLHYQPQVDGGGRLIGAEALVRWRHPQRGLVAPGSFIPAAEELGLIVPLGNWVLHAGGVQARQWCGENDGPVPRLAVNVSAQQFHQEDFIASCERTLSECGIAPRHLELEVTESLLLQDIDSAVRKMDRLREMGIRFSVDDFGTGYSSLAYLRRLPVDQLKIDRSFVTNVYRDERNAAIVRAIISLAGSLGLKTIAEGVEQEEEAVFLREAGCDHFQGFLYGRPLPPEEFFRRWGWNGT